MTNPALTIPALVVLAFLVLAILVLLGWTTNQRRRSEMLRERFGPEYDRTVQTLGDRRKAEMELASRTKRVEALPLHPLSPEQRTGFLESWRSTQAHFVDDPAAAVREADRLVTEVMQARGYPMGTFEQRAADISVDHADVVDNYRNARDIAQRNDRGEGSTEDLRQSMVYYHRLFDDLLETSEPQMAQEKP